MRGQYPRDICYSSVTWWDTLDQLKDFIVNQILELTVFCFLPLLTFITSYGFLPCQVCFFHLQCQICKVIGSPIRDLVGAGGKRGSYLRRWSQWPL